MQLYAGYFSWVASNGFAKPSRTALVLLGMDHFSMTVPYWAIKLFPARLHFTSSKPTESYGQNINTGIAATHRMVLYLGQQ